jgi:CHAT domain-containing protein
LAEIASRSLKIGTVRQTTVRRNCLIANPSCSSPEYDLISYDMAWRGYSGWAAAASVMLISGMLWWGARRSAEPAALLADTYSAARPFEYRLPDRGYGTVRRMAGANSAFDRPAALINAENEIRGRLASHPSDAGMLSLKGRAELLNGDYEHAIESFERSRDVMPSEPQTLSDLATAYAVRGDAEKKFDNYPLAIDLDLRALEKQPNNNEILFNLAIVYERMSMVDEGIDAWNRVLATMPGPGWADEARRNLNNLAVIEAKKAALVQVTADPAQFLSKVAGNSEFDSELYQDILWQEWLPAILANPAAREAAVKEAREFNLQHNDGSLEKAVAEAGDPRLATAFQDVASAITNNRAGQTDAARDAAERAAGRLEQTAGRNYSPGLLRARVETAYAARKSGFNDACLQQTELVIGAAERAGYRWLAGQAHLEHASCADGLSRAGTVLAELTQTRSVLSKAGLEILALRASGFLTGADRENSNFSPIWDTAAAGLASYWRSGALPSRAQEFSYNMQVAANEVGLTDCAEIFARATIRFVQQFGNRAMEADDRVYFAGVLAKRGKRTEEISELNRADALLNSMPAGRTRDYLLWDTGMMRAEALSEGGDSASAIRLLDHLALSSRAGALDEHVHFQTARGTALAAAGDWHNAAQAYRDAVSLNQRKLASLHRWLDRLAYAQSAARAYRSLASIQLLEEKNPKAALATWRLFKSAGGSAASLSLPDALHLTYVVLPAGIAIFSEFGDSLRVRLIQPAHEEFERTARSFARMCANPSSDLAALRQNAHQLFLWLIAPELRETKASSIFIGTDSWLGAIPFAALTDDAGNWLCRSRAVATITGPEDSAPVLKNQAAPVATIVSAPRAIAPGGDRLPLLSASDAEAAEVASFFSKATVLRGSAASGDAILSLISRTSVFHFSGHGWSNSGNGALILSPTSEGDPQFITSKELANQNFSHCSLAVLSACLTAMGEQSGSVNNESLVQALLGAGAANVVAARWYVDSEATRALMRRFYAAVHDGAHPASALASASALTASQAEWAHPYYWAGFDVYGKENGR